MEEYFEFAIKEAKKSYKKNEIPVGAVIVKNGKIIAKAHNNRQIKHSVLGHAEILSIIKASKKIKDWRLDGCEMYVTLEPCEMCNVIINESRISNVYYLINQKKCTINTKTNISQTNDCEYLKKEYEKLLQSFFYNLRNNIIK